MCKYVDSQRVLAAAIRNGSNGYIRADISSAQIRRGGGRHNGANPAAEFPQIFNFAGSIFGAIVISVSIKTMWILHKQRFCSSSFKPNTILMFIYCRNTPPAPKPITLQILQCIRNNENKSSCPVLALHEGI